MSAIEQGLCELRIGYIKYEANDGRDEVRGSESKWLKQVNDNIAHFRASATSDQEQAALKTWDANFPAYPKIRTEVFGVLDRSEPEDEREAVRTGHDLDNAVIPLRRAA